jgi:hypothetical protein
MDTVSMCLYEKIDKTICYGRQVKRWSIKNKEKIYGNSGQNDQRGGDDQPEKFFGGGD